MCVEKGEGKEPDAYFVYKYLTEWSHEGVRADRKFAAICDQVREYVCSLEATLIEICVKALEKVRNDSFAEIGEDFHLRVTFSDRDEDKHAQHQRMARLNSKRITNKFKQLLDS